VRKNGQSPSLAAFRPPVRLVMRDGGDDEDDAFGIKDLLQGTVAPARPNIVSENPSESTLLWAAGPPGVRADPGRDDLEVGREIRW